VPAQVARFSDFIRVPGPGHRSRVDRLSSTLDPDDTVAIQFVDGTSGGLTAAVLSHFGVVNNARYCGKRMRLSAADRFSLPMPLHRHAGWGLGVLGSCAAGATMVFPGESSGAEATLTTMSRYRCTALSGPAAAWLAQLELVSAVGSPSLRTGLITDGPCPPDIARRATDDMHAPEITVAYSTPGDGPVSFQSDGHDAVERHSSTVGRAHPHLEAKIVGEEGRVVPVGRPGELCVRGYAVPRGHWDGARVLKTVTDDAGWVHSGDRAVIDPDGRCHILGRADARNSRPAIPEKTG
jgi:fatty-acyl-CoA synthase